ncbi:hypothetical protein KC347_g313 [Hortaea werneckii]|nr:hypothetical protein KC347_g313 [Hortaea werneckii]
MPMQECRRSSLLFESERRLYRAQDTRMLAMSGMSPPGKAQWGWMQGCQDKSLVACAVDWRKCASNNLCRLASGATIVTLAVACMPRLYWGQSVRGSRGRPIDASAAAELENRAFHQLPALTLIGEMRNTAKLDRWSTQGLGMHISLIAVARGLRLALLPYWDEYCLRARVIIAECFERRCGFNVGSGRMTW